MSGAQQEQPEVHEQALRWHAAVGRGDADWEAFTTWLEAAPAHREAYEQLALVDALLERHAPALRATATPRSRPRLWAMAATLSGVLLAALLAYRLLPDHLAGASRTFAAQAAATRDVPLAGGMHVLLAPGSTLTVAGARDQQLTLTGSAWFDVPHDPGRELQVAIGPYRLRDIGTQFEVTGDASLLKVAVAEGELRVELPGSSEPARVHAGQRLLVAGVPPIAEYADVAGADLASWRTGRLVFSDEPLSLVALQVGRHAGVAVTVDPAVAQRRFSGVLAIGDGTQLVAQLADIMGLHAQRDGAVVHLLAGDAGPGR